MQNTSSAVMQQRREPDDSLDDFPTPPWATRALIEHVIWPNLGVFAPSDHMRENLTCWEPACNRGHMAKPLAEYFRSVHASDVHDYSLEWPGQHRVKDFLFPYSEPRHIEVMGVDWIITNPPFRLAEQFIARAWQIKGVEGVAMIVRTSFLEGVGRYESLFKRNPPSIVAQFSERVPMVKGRLTATGSTATSYCWRWFG
ncbi:hypothetical protein FHS85_002905 [Rhodoligotrophos appendicifer]|uniref:class I SAM-dependent methyltransferase n=1 Tax=Rhodoligotrophos appendicifer TaxID=987056 RepID=UPI001FE9A6C2|nr:class I SAM-dependent methyltransferase [Rhodoligotrophos appendicifer]